ncbi:peroxidase-related enzyme [Marivibrio halodurans]|uniref:Peroxidase-related enzyme n=1 Tax=Marivibrio halodurans TaxID=2039722 RepID=A0A8J7UZM5_9PROT|nr:peroxidase-related enzyme [Marivibrio halodurans]MBP5855841.1 peroxidase-related enzyme [Marivibrio halodurans]
MSRLSIPTHDAAPEASKPILDAVKQQLGTVPNLFRVIANSPVALGAYAGFQGALGKALDLKTRERIALAVAQGNGCAYCLSAHSYLARNLAKLTAEEVALNRRGASGDAKADAAVAFAAKVARERGHVDAADVAAVRAAGFTDGQIVEIVALVAENSFTNFLNEVAGTEIDFPLVEPELEPAQEVAA